MSQCRGEGDVVERSIEFVTKMQVLQCWWQRDVVEVLFEDSGVSSSRWELLLEDGVQILPDAVTIIMTFQTGEQLVQNFAVGPVA